MTEVTGAEGIYVILYATGQVPTQVLDPTSVATTSPAILTTVANGGTGTGQMYYIENITNDVLHTMS